MALRDFSLKPFPGNAGPPGISISGSIARRAGALSVRYEVRGDLPAVTIPPRSDAPGRRDRLWEETCLELFLGIADDPEYREFNLSPAGHWNVYRFASYREGMREDTAFATLPFEVRLAPGSLRLSLDLEIGTIVPARGTVEAAACAVVRAKTGETSHWALAHTGPRPDFHRRDGFVLSIPAST